jgi:proline racemase
MKWCKTVTVYGVHAEGEVGRVITGGIINVPGKTMLDKMLYLNEKDDSIRRFVLYEPRGSAQMSANLLLSPTDPEADAGFIVMQPDGCHALSGSNTMCVATALLETGMLPMVEPETTLKLETPAGIIPVVATCENGKVKSVAVDVVPSFVEHLDYPVIVVGLGKITVDIAFGGCYFAMVDVDQLSIDLSPEKSRQLVELAIRIKKAVKRQITVEHPEIISFNQIEYIMYTSQNIQENCYQNATIIHPGRVDRSPCGTGSAARLAVMYAKGLVSEGEKVIMQSITGSRFETKIVGTTTVGNHLAVIPRISGRAWIYAIEQMGVDPTDPYPFGYTMSDTWGPEL